MPPFKAGLKRKANSEKTSVNAVEDKVSEYLAILTHCDD